MVSKLPTLPEPEVIPEMCKFRVNVPMVLKILRMEHVLLKMELVTRNGSLVLTKNASLKFGNVTDIMIVVIFRTKLIYNAISCNAVRMNGCAKMKKNVYRKNGDAISTRIVGMAVMKTVLQELVQQINLGEYLCI